MFECQNVIDKICHEKYYTTFIILDNTTTASVALTTPIITTTTQLPITTPRHRGTVLFFGSFAMNLNHD